MKIFLSWSGERSHMVASALKTWLNDTIHHLDPWLSSEDIAKGARWSEDLLSELEGTNTGIICLTPENLTAPWVLFESGALAKALDKSRVCTYLYGLKRSDIEGPLVQFQSTLPTKKDTFLLLQSLNEVLPESDRREKHQLEKAFERWWPDLEDAFAKIPSTPSNSKSIRDDREILEEVLDLVRFQTDRLIEPKEPIPRLFQPISALFSKKTTHSFLDGEDINQLAQTCILDGGPEDDNFKDWTSGIISKPKNTIEGEWSSRWRGGTARSSWRTGKSRIMESRNYVILWYECELPKNNPYIIISRRVSDSELHGRYINLFNLADSTPWVGLIVDYNRIDGIWAEGRWDFRR